MVKKLAKKVIIKTGRKMLCHDFIARPVKKILYNHPSLFSRLQVLIVSRNDQERIYESPRKSSVYQELLEELKKSQEKNHANFN